MLSCNNSSIVFETLSRSKYDSCLIGLSLISFILILQTGSANFVLIHLSTAHFGYSRYRDAQEVVKPNFLLSSTDIFS